MRIIALAALISALPGAPLSAAPTVLKPTSKWVVDYADSKCRLLRVFEAGENRSIVYLEQAAPGPDFTLTMAGPALRRFEMDREAGLRFSDSGLVQKARPFTGTIATVGPSVVFASIGLYPEPEDDAAPQPGLPHIAEEDAERAEYVELEQGARHVQFATGNLKAPVAALNACSADLIRAWGLDLDKHRAALSGPVWTNRMAVVRRIASVYPSQALARGEQGLVRMRVMVDAAGGVTDCFVENVTLSETLKTSACRNMKLARFEPARDAAGSPMPSYYATNIVYAME